MLTKLHQIAFLLGVLLVLSSQPSMAETENIAQNPTPPAETGRDFKVLHVYVALCDNASQGIVPVPAKIGNGDDPAKVHPVLMTQSNMYPGAFILHDALEGWFAKESVKKIRLRAAKAYAKNQKISTKSALTVFAILPH